MLILELVEHKTVALVKCAQTASHARRLLLEIFCVAQNQHKYSIVKIFKKLSLIIRLYLHSIYLVCPQGMKSHINPNTGQETNCLKMNCPVGYECVYSKSSSQYVCCHQELPSIFQ